MTHNIFLRGALALGLFPVFAACVPTTSAEIPTPVPLARAVSAIGLASVIGHDARAIEAQFGRPDLDVREGTARKLQFSSAVCVLDVYLYPPVRGGDPVATHVDARLPDGRDLDRASCVAALNRRGAAR